MKVRRGKKSIECKTSFSFFERFRLFLGSHKKSLINQTWSAVLTINWERSKSTHIPDSTHEFAKSKYWKTFFDKNYPCAVSIAHCSRVKLTRHTYLFDWSAGSSMGFRNSIPEMRRRLRANVKPLVNYLMTSRRSALLKVEAERPGLTTVFVSFFYIANEKNSFISTGISAVAASVENAAD